MFREIPLPLSSSHPPHNHETPSNHRKSEYREGQDDRQPHPRVNSRGVEKGERHSHGGEVDHGKHKDATQASPLLGDAADTNVVSEHELKEENNRQRHDRKQQPDFAGRESEDYCDEDSAQNDVQEKASRNFDPSPETAFSTGHADAPSTSPGIALLQETTPGSSFVAWRDHLITARRSRKRRTRPTPYSTMATNSAPLGTMPKNIRRKIMEAPEYKTPTTRNTARSREWDGGNSALPLMPKPPSPRSGKALAAENHLVLARSFSRRMAMMRRRETTSHPDAAKTPIARM